MHVTALSCSPATLSYGEDGVYSRRSFSMVGGVGSPPLPLRAVIVIVPIVSVLSYVMLVADVCMRKCLLVAERMSQSMIKFASLRIVYTTGIREIREKCAAVQVFTVANALWP